MELDLSKEGEEIVLWYRICWELKSPRKQTGLRCHAGSNVLFMSDMSETVFASSFMGIRDEWLFLF
jgi:hypothetical protein